MANSKISALDAVTTPESSDVLPIVNDSSTKKITVANLVQNASFDTSTGHDHDGTDSKVVDHVNLSNKGTNTHTQIDSHIANVSNPHTVTASQVGSATAQWNASKLQGVNIGTTAPTNSQVLAYNGSTLAWEPNSAATPGAHAETHEEGGSDPITFPSWLASGETWTYVSASSFSVPTDLTTKYTKGTKIQLVNDGSTKYFYVVSSSYSSVTTVTLSGEVDLVSGAITSGKYSYMDNPQGFKRGEDWFAASASRAAAQSIPDDAITKINLTTEDFDYNSNFDEVTNYNYTVPIDGRYTIEISAAFGLINESTECEAIVFAYKNGSLLFQGNRTRIQATSAVTFLLNGSQTVELSKGDEIDLRVYQDSSTSRNVTLSHLGVMFVGL